MTTIGMSQEPTVALEFGVRAHRLIDQFLARQKDCPERAWESVAELQELLEQLQSIYPPRTFRRDGLAGPKLPKESLPIATRFRSKP